MLALQKLKAGGRDKQALNSAPDPVNLDPIHFRRVFHLPLWRPHTTPQPLCRALQALASHSQSLSRPEHRVLANVQRASRRLTQKTISRLVGSSGVAWYAYNASGYCERALTGSQQPKRSILKQSNFAGEDGSTNNTTLHVAPHGATDEFTFNMTRASSAGLDRRVSFAPNAHVRYVCGSHSCILFRP